MSNSMRSPTPLCPAGLASLQLDFNAQENPAIFDQLLAQTPASLIARGRPILAEQQRLVAEAVSQAYTVRLGGAAHAGQDWGRCLAVTVGDELARLRSQLGNALAQESARRGLRAMGLVAYLEVGGRGSGAGEGWRRPSLAWWAVTRSRHRGVGTRAWCRWQGQAKRHEAPAHVCCCHRQPGAVPSPCLQAAMNDSSRIKVSVRSIGEAEDTTPISEAYGGGGHRNASSFICGVSEFEAWRE